MIDALGAETKITPEPLGSTEPGDGAAPLSKPAQRLVCRRMAEADIPSAVDLLSRGFPERTPVYWRVALERLRDRESPEDRPRFGYVMTDHGQLVGIVLTIFAMSDTGETRANVSSWYVDPAYRGFSHLLLAIPLKLKDVTLFNISPTSTTIDTVVAQGFSCYSQSSFQTLAFLAPPVRGARLRRITSNTPDAPKLLVDHARWGCFCFELTFRGESFPFVFVASRMFGGRLPCAQLIYCRDVDDFVHFAGPLGRALLRHNLPVVMIDADAPPPRLLGSLRVGRSLRFFRGAAPPRVGDLGHTELAIFGF